MIRNCGASNFYIDSFILVSRKSDFFSRVDTALSYFLREIYEIHFNTVVDCVVHALVTTKSNRQQRKVNFASE